jgi:hypothetical protein
VVKNAVFGLLGAALVGWILALAVAPAREIWRGNAARTRSLPTSSGRLPARCYLAYLLWMVPGCTGLVIIILTLTVEGLVGAHHDVFATIGRTGFGIFTLALPFLPVHLWVKAFNRPSFLVPPPYLEQRGALAERRERRRRAQAGLPPTDHVVEIVDVRPIPEGTDIGPYLRAVCTVGDCPWHARAEDAGGPDAWEADLRRQASQHTTAVASVISRMPSTD